MLPLKSLRLRCIRAAVRAGRSRVRGKKGYLRQCAVFLLFAFAAFLVGCGHTSDSGLEGMFYSHEEEFEALLMMAQSEPKIITITPTVVVTSTSVESGWPGAQRLGLSRATWDRYQRLFKDLRLDGGVSKGEHGAVSFKADGPSLLNGDSEKGYVYSPLPLSPTVEDLGRFKPLETNRNSHGSYLAYRPIKLHWYLYLNFG
jgi:hypothetical protein